MKNSIPTGIVLGLVGPPGIGKGYVTRSLRDTNNNLDFIYKVTTRSPRPVDTIEGVRSGLNPDFFTDPSNIIVAEHQPFHDERRYGWLLNGVKHGTKEGKSYIFDPNVEFLGDFKKELGKDLLLIGMMAGEDYLLENLFRRTNGNPDRTVLDDIKIRLAMGKEYMENMIVAYSQGQIDRMILLNQENRVRVAEVISEVSWEIYRLREGNVIDREGVLSSAGKERR